MLHIQRWKIVLVIVLSFLGVAYAMPNLLPAGQVTYLQENTPSWFPQNTINLGLDLQGGSHLLLQVDTDYILKERIEAFEDAVRTELRKEKIGYLSLNTKPRGVTFKLRDAEKDRSQTYKVIRDIAEGMLIDNDGDSFDVYYDDQKLAELNTQVVNQSIEIVRRRIDESGTKEPLIQRQGADRIVVQLPGVDDPERVKELLGKTAKMTFHLVDETAVVAGIGSRKLPMHESPGQSMIVKKKVEVSGDMLTDSQPGFDQNGEPVVNFSFDSIGAKKFCEISRNNIGKPFAVVLDDEIISAPVIRSAICGGHGQISGNFTVKEANDLSLLLRAGALPAPLNVVEERSVGPTLGSDSVESGKVAALVALGLVVVYMVLSYGLLGLFADIALLLNVAFIFAIMSILQATLTLPGIAGIILTIGMAVDANVLIYERIREELRSGRGVMPSVDTGYQMAKGTIIDSNLTTLIVAIILFSFGTGPVKGFAVSMSIGIVTSMFSAIMITRLLVVTWLKRVRPSKLEV